MRVGRDLLQGCPLGCVNHVLAGFPQPHGIFVLVSDGIVVRGTIASASSISAGVGVLPVVLVDRPPGVVQVLALRPLLVVLAAAAMALRRSKVEVEP